ncbi:MAG: hypothetical protein M1819_004246 [Sarea resinae]|nr:MAG: hypothetical protein M1819_004246 [Sarea resinae]
MPRPPRSKVAPSAPASRVKKPTVGKATSSQHRLRAEDILADDGSSDSSTPLTTKRKVPRLSRLAANEKIEMKGGLGPGDVPDPTRRSRVLRQRAVNVASATDEKNAKAIEALKARKKAREGGVEIPGTVRKETESQGENVVGTTRATDQRPGLRRKVPGTPGVDNSVLAIANFKRRPRQPSILRMVRQDDTDEDEDDFNPDDESTPLKLDISKPHIDDEPTSLSTPRSPPTSSSRKRKLTPPTVEVPRSSPPPAVSPSGESALNDQSSQSISLPDIEAIGEETRQESRDKHEVAPELDSETMAPPRSSSPGSPEPISRTRSTRAGSKQTQSSRLAQAAKQTAPADFGSPPARNKKARRRDPVSTAALQNLLPRRRRRGPRGDFDVLSSSEAEATPIVVDEDEDELTFVPNRKTAQRQSRAAKTTKPTVKKRGRPAKTKSTKLTATQTKGLRTYTRRASSDKENEGTIRVLPAASNPGNDSLGPLDDSTDATPTRKRPEPAPEIEAARQKFQEVDQWELAFEDVTASSSSPWEGR